MIQGVVFDIDDTLYLERTYVASGFSFVARTIGLAADEVSALGSWLEDAFARGIRGDTFDRLRAAFPLVAARFSTAQLVDLYRGHPPTVSLVPGAVTVFESLRRRGIRIGALSDGPAVSQSQKVRVLGLERWCDPIVLTDLLGPGCGKPATLGFSQIAESWGLPGPSLCYVGDDPAKDFRGARGLGWLTVRLRHPDQLRAGHEPVSIDDRPHLEIATLADLPSRLGL